LSNPIPKVTVLMAVHNGLPYLAEAVESILGQTLQNFEFLIVNDASTDGSSDLLRGYTDKRIRTISNQKQLELARSLNLGIDAALGDYIARMDHDDVSLPARLAKQVRFLDAHPDIDVVGTDARTIGASVEQSWSYPQQDEDIRSEFVFNSALVHSSVMMRRSTFERHKLRYAHEFTRAQDYELWTRAAKDIRFANLGEELVRYRIHEKQVGKQQAHEQRVAASRIRERELTALGFRPDEREVLLHNAISQWDFSASGVNLDDIEQWFLKLESSNKLSEHYPLRAFGRALERRWWAACRTNVKKGLAAWRIYTKSPLSALGRRSLLSRAKFFGKALLREQKL
jgi:glycosyltransferase involved in cell wall biosynthesis